MTMFSCWPLQRLGASLLLLLALICAACSPAATSATSQANSSSSTSHRSGNATSTTALAPRVQFRTQPCPSAVKDPAHWDPIIPTQSGTTQVGGVSCGNLLGNASLQALVNV